LSGLKPTGFDSFTVSPANEQNRQNQQGQQPNGDVRTFAAIVVNETAILAGAFADRQGSSRQKVPNAKENERQQTGTNGKPSNSGSIRAAASWTDFRFGHGSLASIDAIFSVCSYGAPCSLSFTEEMAFVQ
jgi:hypothetical protein